MRKGKRGMDPLRFNLSTRQMQAVFHATSDLSRETGPWYPLDRTLPGTQSWFGCVREEKTFLPLWGIEQGPFGPSNKSLYTIATNKMAIMFYSNGTGRRGESAGKKRKQGMNSSRDRMKRRGEREKK